MRIPLRSLRWRHLAALVRSDSGWRTHALPCFRSTTITLFLFLVSILSAAQGARLLEYLPDGVAGTAMNEEPAQGIIERASSSAGRLARVDLSALEAEWVALQLPDGPEIQIKLDRVLRYRNGAFSWSGSILAGGGTATFTVFGDELSGEVSTMKSAYIIQPAGGGLYLVRRSIPGTVPPADPPQHPALQ